MNYQIYEVKMKTILEKTQERIKALENGEVKTTALFDSTQTLKSLKHKEKVLMNNAEAIANGKKDLADVWAKLNQIEAKEKCLRVRMLDWLSDKLLNWSNRVHVMACNIDSPCLIEIPPRKKEDSQHAKESKKIGQLKELLASREQANEELRKQNRELTENMLKEFADLQKEMKK